MTVYPVIRLSLGHHEHLQTCGVMRDWVDGSYALGARDGPK
jgi:hypothetical protein